MVPTRTKFAVGKEQSSNKLKLRVREQFSKSADCDARLPFRHTGILRLRLIAFSIMQTHKTNGSYKNEVRSRQGTIKQ